MISEHDRAHIDDIIGGHGDWFTAQLLRLCAKADPRNLEKIRLGFPEVVEAFEKWKFGKGIVPWGPDHPSYDEMGQ
jgi:hypothetical protein